MSTRGNATLSHKFWEKDNLLWFLRVRFTLSKSAVAEEFCNAFRSPYI